MPGLNKRIGEWEKRRKRGIEAGELRIDLRAGEWEKRRKREIEAGELRIDLRTGEWENGRKRRTEAGERWIQQRERANRRKREIEALARAIKKKHEKRRAGESGKKTNGAGRELRSRPTELKFNHQTYGLDRQHVCVVVQEQSSFTAMVQ